MIGLPELNWGAVCQTQIAARVNQHEGRMVCDQCHFFPKELGASVSWVVWMIL